MKVKLNSYCVHCGKSPFMSNTIIKQPLKRTKDVTDDVNKGLLILDIVYIHKYFKLISWNKHIVISIFESLKF